MLNYDLAPCDGLYLLHLVMKNTGERRIQREKRRQTMTQTTKVEPKEKHECLYPAVQLVHLNDQ